MESAPMNVNAGIAQKRQLLARLMAQAQANRPGGAAGFRAGVLGGRPVHNASDLSAAPLPQINMGAFRPASGLLPPGFQGDPTLPQAAFAGGGPASWTSAPGVGPGGGGPPGPPAAPGGGDSIMPTINPSPVYPTSMDAPRTLTDQRTDPGNLQGYPAPDPWAVFRLDPYGSMAQYRGGGAGRGVFQF